MHLSILIPTHRDSLLACSRIAQACSWAGEDIEVIVRDNSGNAQKRELLSIFRRDNCHIILAEPCGAWENFSEVLRPAKGEFVFVVADDDFCFDRAIASLPGIIAQIRSDQSVVGVSGACVIEASQGTSIANYNDLESEDVAARLKGYLSYRGPNVLFYSPVRLALCQRVFAFTKTLPFNFTFHDQICCLLYLVSGKFVKLQRFLYLYDYGLWETGQAAQDLDVEWYRKQGFDPGINKLHWFLCGFEGAVLILNSDFPSFPATQRQSIADLWFAVMFARFKRDVRLIFESSAAAEADKLCAKLQTSTGQLSFHDMLTAISEFIALTGKNQSQDYFYYWESMLNKRQPELRKTGS
jgi:hypothetical protein